MRRAGSVLLAILLLTAAAFAQADGPDYFRITGVKKDDNINVRRQPNADAKIAGKIPKDADGIKNLGCNRGGLTEAQWDKASEKRKLAAASKRWCRVSYNDVTGWVSARFLTEGTGPKSEPKAEPQPQAAPVAPAPAAEIKPSFDCGKTEKNAEKMICADAGLAALDREMALVYELAHAGANATPLFGELLDSQRSWVNQRNTCFDNDCVAEITVRRIHQLRQGYADARKPAAKGLSLGPLVARCAGFDASIGVSFVNSDPAYAYAEWPDGYAVMKQAPSGSGARYEGNFANLWNKGSEATIKLPDGKELTCKLEQGG